MSIESNLHNDLLSLIQDDKLHRLDDEMTFLNIFELVGLQNQEIRHSHFLSELLNPNSILNIGDKVLKCLVRDAFKSVTSNTINTLSPIDFELGDFDNFEVRREYRNIDLLLLNHSDEKSKYCICIENKVDSSESKEQLTKYRDIVEGEFPSYKKLYLFLTPLGIDAEWDTDWISVSYDPIVQGLDKISDNASLNNDIKLLIEHYKALLEKHVVGQDELQQLAREIYNKHKNALDFIFENKPDRILELSTMFHDWLSTKADEWNITTLQPSKIYVGFVTSKMRAFTQVLPGNGWKSNDIVIMEISTRNNSVTLKTILGKTEDTEERQAFLSFLQSNYNVKSNSSQYSTIHSQSMYRGNLQEEDSMIQVFDKVVNKLEREIPKEAKRIDAIIDEYLDFIKK